MPAVLNEAFNSPFNRHLGGTPSVSSGDTESIRNPLWMANVQSNNSNSNSNQGSSPQYQINQPYENLFPRAQNTNYVTFPSQQTQYQPQYQHQHQHQPPVQVQVPQYQHQPPVQQYQHQMQQLKPQSASPHDCERLIAMMMACAICRNKIRDILRNDMQQSGETLSPQSGGAFPQLPPIPDIPALKGVNTTAIGNFIFGIAIIFLVDKIIKKRGC
jgi:hypothetical protein